MVWYYSRADLKRATLLCVIVGSWLVIFNQGSILLAGGSLSGMLFVKILLDYATPFTVSSVTSMMRNRSDRLSSRRGSGGKI